MKDLEFRTALLADPLARSQSERLARAFAQADAARLDAALQAGDIVAFQRELGLSDAEFVGIADELDRARQSALRRASEALPAA
ncbi:MAG TPA: hypothetical protein VL972_08815 [Solirubrobacteraceae bacterium]|nr:hypothetical protein [Solirubrobacteraceae bacterium]